MKPRVSTAHEVSCLCNSPVPSQAPPCPKYSRDTRKNGIHHVFTSSTQWSQCSLWGMLKLEHTVLDPELGWGCVSLGLHIGSFPAPSGGKSCFHLRVLESWALWHLESEPPISCPIGMGLGEDLALAVGKVMAPSGLWSLTERKGCHQDKPLIGIRFDGQGLRGQELEGLLGIPGRDQEAGPA